ncbi:macrophage-expressed gene 1 protein-like [Scyliorhinus torazame]|uniref:macrophage-expressed gene 1 protein-like n=1 Tax=Scyliorhinus torazame TaxID=75743 RepID=UPI003B5A3DF1
MYLVLVHALLCILAVGAAESGLQAPSADSLTECRKIRKDLTALEVLPGGGWDNLRNLDRGRVMDASYSQCRTTDDGLYLIPDQVYVVPLKRTSVDMMSELIEDWRKYESTTSASVNAELSFLPFLNGKFSADNQRVRTQQARGASVTTRIQVRNLVYEVRAQAHFQLDRAFRQQLVRIGNSIENNQTAAARYYAELLVRDYGTHLLTSVQAGASLLQEDQLRSSFVADSRGGKTAITASASATFFRAVNLGLGAQAGQEEQQTRLYLGNRSHSRIESHGGAPFYPGVTLQRWQEQLAGHLVAIDRAGQPLHLAVGPRSVPELPEPTALEVSRAVERAVGLYYAVNAHPGCLDATSPNFNLGANLEDGSCADSFRNFTFGGAFQECSPLPGPDAGPLCRGLEQRNPLTGSFSCPPGYAAARLRDGLAEEAYSRYECRQHCHTCWLLATCCQDVCGDAYYVRRAQFRASWCAAGPLRPASGYLFGGLYTAGGAGNPLTRDRSCPPSFYPLVLLRGLRVCVGDDYELGLRYSVPFGGFFSCEAGNPLAGRRGRPQPDAEPPQAHPKRCPPGHSQHRADISDGCQVLYCVKSGAYQGLGLPRLNAPPFSQLPLLSGGPTNTVVVLAEHQQPWLKDSRTELWKTARASDASRLFPERPSPGSTAGIAVSVTLAVVGLIALAYYGRRRWKSRGYQTLRRSSASSDSAEPQVAADSRPLIQDGEV